MPAAGNVVSPGGSTLGSTLGSTPGPPFPFVVPASPPLGVLSTFCAPVSIPEIPPRVPNPAPKSFLGVTSAPTTLLLVTVTTSPVVTSTSDTSVDLVSASTALLAADAVSELIDPPDNA